MSELSGSSNGSIGGPPPASSSSSPPPSPSGNAPLPVPSSPESSAAPPVQGNSLSPPPPPRPESSSSSPPPPAPLSGPPPPSPLYSSPPPPLSNWENKSAALLAPPPPNSKPPSPPISNSPPPAPVSQQPPPPSPTPPPTTSSSSPPPASPPPSPSSSSSPTPPPPAPSPTSVSNQSSPPPSSTPPPPPSTPPPTYSPPPPALTFPPGAQIPPPPPYAIPPPQISLSPAVPTPPSVGTTPPGQSVNTTPSRTPSPVAKLKTPPASSSTGVTSAVPSNPSPNSSISSRDGAIIGAAVSGVVIVTMVVCIFFISKTKKKRGSPPFTAQYGPTPTNFIVESDGYVYMQQHAPQQHPPHQILVGSNNVDGFYNGMPPLSPSVHECNSGSVGPESGVIGGSKSCFSYEELMQITNGFSQQNVLGEGGFGCVYKGWLPDGRVVAVKQLKAGSGQGEREFRAEVEIISRVHHRHLVSLVGYCIANHHRLLVYEFLPNNNLEHHLHGKGMPVLEWSKRIKIALGAARGLAYLHEDCHPRIIHRDIKTANILLDNSFEAQVADFGLAKLSNDAGTHISTRVMGTFGYLAPEYASSGKLTDRSDVYSFGVVLLELVTGRKPVDPNQPLGDESLVEWARPILIHALDTGDFKALIDPRLEKNYVESEMIRMIEAAAACVRHSAPRRPRMSQVVRALDIESDITDLTNGVKFGQSTVYESAQYSADIRNFRRMAFGSWGGSDYDMSSGERSYISSGGKSFRMLPSSSAECSSSDSETHAMNPQGNAPRTVYGTNQFIPR